MQDICGCCKHAATQGPTVKAWMLEIGAAYWPMCASGHLGDDDG